MFTGLIQSLGQIQAIDTLGNGLEIQIQGPFPFEIQQGDSISVNGVCSTALNPSAEQFSVQYLPETLSKTNLSDVKVADSVNLEPSLRLNDRLGGHIVSGHVDCEGAISEIKSDGPFSEFTIQFPPEWYANIIPKGSIAIDGISLTIVEAGSSQLSCHIIPETLKKTTLGFKKVGDSVNLEFDMLGKYYLRQDAK